MERYFDLIDDVSIPGRWELSSPYDEQGQKVDPWPFLEGMPVDAQEKLSCRLKRPGQTLDFSHASFSIPVLSQRAKQLFQRLGGEDVQFFPLRVERQEEPYFLMNVTRLVDCIDEARCRRAERWKPEDGRPEMLGEYRVVEDMHIDPARVAGARIFRTKGWPVLVVAGSVKQAMEQMGLTGPKFKEV